MENVSIRAKHVLGKQIGFGTIDSKIAMRRVAGILGSENEVSVIKL